MIDEDAIAAHRAARADAGPSGDPRHGAEPRHVLPGARGVQPVLRRLPRHRARRRWTRFAALTGRQYRPVRLRRPSAGRARDRHHGLGRARRCRRRSNCADRARREASACVKVRLYRPFSIRGFRRGAAATTVAAIAVLDRTKEPGAVGEPLYLDVVAALARGTRRRRSPLRPIRWSSAAATACLARNSRRRW